MRYIRNIIIALIIVLTAVILRPKHLANEIVIQPPAPKPAPLVKQLASRAAKPQPRRLKMLATAYTASSEEGTADGRTATGIKVRRGVVAVDPKVIPLGTKLYIEGYGEAIAADTGGAIKGNKIDLFMDSKQEALRWGRRWVLVTIY
ncbi:hypothetical protein MTAT_19090 [Moorella thermoacetica]|uniref:Cell wall-binding protein YocH n=2 Tax=Neomoorella thermoacetica TaxID=1525 RepID=A0AAC9HIV1_NEOTH|nr:3D domain-containing protein [Moorella thermoacetica]AOQ24566.1 Cell wall-binding protein YocH precursor [Moorella thermoacetica]TYL12667.1 hypothetical protein MTAT_19090 [Moorella thermoacetica]